MVSVMMLPSLLCVCVLVTAVCCVYHYEETEVQNEAQCAFISSACLLRSQPVGGSSSSYYKSGRFVFVSLFVLCCHITSLCNLDLR